MNSVSAEDHRYRNEVHRGADRGSSGSAPSAAMWGDTNSIVRLFAPAGVKGGRGGIKQTLA
jgi:hypothetical protein